MAQHEGTRSPGSPRRDTVAASDTGHRAPAEGVISAITAADDPPIVDDVSFHQIARGHHTVGVWAEIYRVTRPVTAHRHNFYELAFALTGGGQHEDVDGQLPTLSGDVWTIEPGQWHAYPLVGDGLQVFNLLLAPDFLAQYAPALRATLLACPHDADGNNPPPGAATGATVRHVRLSPGGLERIRAVLLALAAEVRHPPTSGLAPICGGLVLQALGLIDRYGVGETYQSDSVLAARGDAGVLAAVRYIEEHYASPLALPDLARHSGYAPTYLARTFRRRLGVPPSDYLLQVRLQHACALLETTDLTVTTIAHRTGFADSRYFATRFRQTLDTTPTAFRAATQDRIAHM